MKRLFKSVEALFVAKIFAWADDADTAGLILKKEETTLTTQTVQP